MQTFLPFPSLGESAVALDSLRLGKQRIECMQLLRGQFPNHPASKMWRGYEAALLWYAVSCCMEWQRRGYRDTVRDKLVTEHRNIWHGVPIVQPSWLDDPRLYRSHRQALLVKAEDDWLMRGDARAIEHYAKFSWGPTPLSWEYYWPSGQ